MVEVKVVAPPVPGDKIETGRRLIQSLDEKASLPVNTAFWMFRPDLAVYRLVLGTPTVRVSGRKQAYKRVQAALLRMNTPELLSDVEVVDSDDPLLRLLKVAIRTPPTALAGITFVGNVINGVSFPDSYIYRAS